MKLKFIFPWLMLSFLAFAKDAVLQPQTQGEVVFVSGGVGGDERDTMQSIGADYNLHLLFSENSTGNYLSDVKVIIKDAGGNILVETVADGPMLFAKLKPGHYSVSADWDGHSIGKTANVDSKHRTSLSFAWPPQSSD